MSDIIKLLPDAIANQIAAGEVVQRPASVVKELLENALDAGAREVKLIIKDAGKGLVQVIDNGSGMSQTDARISFERHATSKIKNADDLFRINTFGFRGEALASIAAVAQVEMRSKRTEEEVGTKLIVEDSEVLSQEVEACPDGTSIAVKNLFFNVPARRNFLKSNSVEMKHIFDEFHRVVLSNNEVHFILINNEVETYNIKPGKVSQRVVALFGKNYQEQLVACQEETTVLGLTGYVGKPEFAKKTRGDQYFFVNDRFIKSNYLNHAVLGAFEGLLSDGCHPFYVLYITIDPRKIDVNVHPTKNEIKFDDERAIYAILRSAIKQALGLHNVAPSIDFSSDINWAKKVRPVGMEPAKQTDRAYGQFKQVSKTPDSKWETLFEQEQQPNFDFDASQGSIKRESGMNQMVAPVEEKVLFQLFNAYVATPMQSGLMVIHQQYAMERIVYERFLINKKEGAMIQQYLFPVTVELNAADFSLVKELWEDIRHLGFDIEERSETTMVLNGGPVDAIDCEGEVLFREMIDAYKVEGEINKDEREERMIAALAKQSALRSIKVMEKSEMRLLIDQLFACANPNYSVDGKKTFVMIDQEGLQKLY